MRLAFVATPALLPDLRPAPGTLDGDVKIVGHGDPTIGGRFHDGHATAVIEEWVTDLKRAGAGARAAAARRHHEQRHAQGRTA